MKISNLEKFAVAFSLALISMTAPSAHADSSPTAVKFRVGAGPDPYWSYDLSSPQGAKIVNDDPKLQTLINALKGVDLDSLATLSSESHAIQTYAKDTLGVDDAKPQYKIELNIDNSKECGYEIILSVDAKNSAKVPLSSSTEYVVTPSKEGAARVAKIEKQQDKAEMWNYSLVQLNECDPSKLKSADFIAAIQSLTAKIKTSNDAKVAKAAALQTTENNVRAVEVGAPAAQ